MGIHGDDLGKGFARRKEMPLETALKERRDSLTWVM